MLCAGKEVSVEAARVFPASVVALVVALSISTGVNRAAAQDDPHFGIWRLSVAKSTFDPGPPLKSQTRWYEPYRGGVRARVETIDANGDRTVGGYIAYFDGRGYPNTDDPDAITISLKRVNGFTIDGMLKRGGVVVLTTTNVVSRDATEMTLTEKGIGADGRPFTNVQVYDKQ